MHMYLYSSGCTKNMGQNFLVIVKLFFLIKNIAQQFQLGIHQILKWDILKDSFQKKKTLFVRFKQMLGFFYWTMHWGILIAHPGQFEAREPNPLQAAIVAWDLITWLCVVQCLKVVTARLHNVFRCSFTYPYGDGVAILRGHPCTGRN